MRVLSCCVNKKLFKVEGDVMNCLSFKSSIGRKLTIFYN